MTTGTESGYDAAFPPGHPPGGDTVVMGYLGGDTPHVWSRAEWNSQPARYRIGIWTRSNPGGASQGTVEGRAAAGAWRSLGATPGSLIVLDYETAIDAAYVTAFDAAVVAAGFKVALYGSKSSLFQNPRPSGGYFPADLTGRPHLYPGTLLTQWAFESAWDDDTISAAAVLWDTRPSPPPPTARRNDMHIDLTINEPEVIANPAAVLGGTSHLCLTSDFGDAVVRLAYYSFNAKSWGAVEMRTVSRTGPAVSIPLPADINKVSATLTSVAPQQDAPAPVAVGLDVLA